MTARSTAILFFFGIGGVVWSASPAEIAWRLTYQVETSQGSGRFHRLERKERWAGKKTAVIVCDMWDAHHGLNAVRRVAELAEPIDRFLKQARLHGITIIHAPSRCMKFYADHPARRRAKSVPRAARIPQGIDAWCHQIPSESGAPYPIDQSDGGEDDDPIEHAQWAEQLEARGRNPKIPWTRQIDTIEIDAERDFVSDNGTEIWSILQDRGIEHVLLVGVHTNMCVLGRPFGLRQMAKNGMRVALVRDLTDTMYNPARRPRVSHFSGTDLVVDYIERYVCPSVLSVDLFRVGDAARSFRPHRFQYDRRLHLVVVIAEDEYDTRRTLPAFADAHLRRDYRVSLVYGSDTERHQIPGLTRIDDADVVLVSIRRRALPPAQMEWFRRHVRRGGAMVGIRTASHAFHLRGKPLPAGRVEWQDFDARVWGGNYHNHYGNQRKPTIRLSGRALSHPLMTGFEKLHFVAGGSLYKNAPLQPGTHVLATGSIDGEAAEPVAWTFVRSDGGRSFYTSLGQTDDFRQPGFVRLLRQGIDWAAGRLATPGGPPSPVP